MGMNNQHAWRYILDIETAPIADAADYLEPLEPLVAPDLSKIAPAKNLVDPIKIQADLDKRQQAATAAYFAQCQQQVAKRRELLERCALDLDLCRIVAIGYLREDWPESLVFTMGDETMETLTLRAFWAELDGRATIGFNQVGFDLPILLRRSFYLGVNAPSLNLDKYRTNHIDLQQRLSFNGTKPYRSLNWYMKRLKIDVTDPVSGKDIGQLVAANDWDGVTAHCRADLVKTRALAERMGIVQPVLDLAEVPF